MRGLEDVRWSERAAFSALRCALGVGCLAALGVLSGCGSPSENGSGGAAPDPGDGGTTAAPCITSIDGANATATPVTGLDGATFAKAFPFETVAVAGIGAALYVAGAAEAGQATLGGLPLAGAGPAGAAGAVARLDASGAVVWATAIDALSVQIRSARATEAGVWVGFSATGNVLVGGNVPVDTPPPGEAPVEYVASFDPSGGLSYVRELPGKWALDANAAGDAVALLLDDDVVLGGETFVCGAVIARLTQAGHIQSARCLGTSGTVTDAALAVDEDGNAYVSGSPTEDLVLGDDLAPSPSASGVVVKLDPAGAVRWTQWFTGAFTSGLVATPGGLLAEGAATTATSRLDLAGTPYELCGQASQLTALAYADGSNLWSRAYGAALDIVGTDRAGDAILAFSRAATASDGGNLQDAFGLVSGEQHGEVRWLRTGFVPTAAGPDGDAWAAAAPLRAATDTLVVDGETFTGPSEVVLLGYR